jgi:hypothetical protein
LKKEIRLKQIFYRFFLEVSRVKVDRTLEVFEEAKRMAKRVMAGQTKDDVIAESIFELFSRRGFSSKKGLTGRGGGDYHYRKFESPFKDFKAVKVRISRRAGWQSGGVGGALGKIGEALGPQRVKIEFEVIYKEGKFLGIGKKSKKFEFTMNADEYIDDELKVKDEEAFQNILKGYLKAIGLPHE